MNKIKKIIISILVALFTLLLIFNINRKPTIYKFDLVDTDLRINNYTILKFNQYYYIPNIYTIEKTDPDKEITDLMFLVYNEDILITSLAFEFPNSDKMVILKDELKTNLQINDKTTLTIKLKYTLNGIDKEFYQSVKLKNCVQDF